MKKSTRGFGIILKIIRKKDLKNIKRGLKVFLLFNKNIPKTKNTLIKEYTGIKLQKGKKGGIENTDWREITVFLFVLCFEL